MSSSWPRDQTCVSHIGKQILYHWATRKAFSSYVNMLRINPDTLCPLPEVHSHTSSPAPMRCLVNFFLSRLLTHSQTLFFRSLGLLPFGSLPFLHRIDGQDYHSSFCLLSRLHLLSLYELLASRTMVRSSPLSAFTHR